MSLLHRQHTCHLGWTDTNGRTKPGSSNITKASWSLVGKCLGVFACDVLVQAQCSSGLVGLFLPALFYTQALP